MRGLAGDHSHCLRLPRRPHPAESSAGRHVHHRRLLPGMFYRRPPEPMGLPEFRPQELAAGAATGAGSRGLRGPPPPPPPLPPNLLHLPLPTIARQVECLNVQIRIGIALGIDDVAGSSFGQRVREDIIGGFVGIDGAEM